MENTILIDDALMRAREKVKGLSNGEPLSAAVMENLLGEQEVTIQICGVSTKLFEAAPIISVKVLFKIRHLDSCQWRDESYETLVDLLDSSPAEAIVAQGIAACKQLFLESKLGISRGSYQQSMQPYPGQLQTGYGQAQQAINQLAARTL